MNLNIGSDWQDRMEETVFSRDFGRLCDMLLFFLRESPFPRPSFPGRRYRVETLQRLARRDKELAERMLWNDLAFNGQDGQGLTLPQRIARAYAQLPSPLEEAKRTCKDSGVRPEAEAVFIAYKREEVLANLRSVRSLRPGYYLPVTGKNRRPLALQGKDGTVYGDVILPVPLPEGYEARRLFAQLVSYRGRFYACAPCLWCEKETPHPFDATSKTGTHPINVGFQ